MTDIDLTELDTSRVRDTRDADTPRFDDEPGIAPTPEEVEAFLDAQAGIPVPANAAGGGRSFVPRLNRYDVDRILTRPQWHGAGAPEAVETAWTAVLAAADALRDAQASLERLDGDRRAEHARVERAVEDGTKVPRPQDWAHEAVIREAQLTVAERRLRASRADYNAIVTAELPVWRTAIADRLEDARQQAEKALRQAAPAFATWRALVGAQEALVRELEPTTHARLVLLDTEARRLRAHGEQGLTSALALVASTHPVLRGSVFIEDEGPRTVPLHVRAWAREQGDSVVFWLASLEASEGWRVTHYAQAVWPTVAPHLQAEGEVLPAPWATDDRPILQDPFAAR